MFEDFKLKDIIKHICYHLAFALFASKLSEQFLILNLFDEK